MRFCTGSSAGGGTGLTFASVTAGVDSAVLVISSTTGVATKAGSEPVDSVMDLSRCTGNRPESESNRSGVCGQRRVNSAAMKPISELELRTRHLESEVRGVLTFGLARPRLRSLKILLMSGLHVAHLHLRRLLLKLM